MNKLQAIIDKKVDPFDPKNHQIPLWCVKGFQCFPSVFCCKLNMDRNDNREVDIWGYSVYRGVPGFRTLGRNLREWNKELVDTGRSDPPMFFRQQTDVLDYLNEVLTPDPSAYPIKVVA